MIAEILIAFLLFLYLVALAGVISLLYDILQELTKITNRRRRGE